jgi:hypothetical protein
VRIGFSLSEPDGNCPSGFWAEKATTADNIFQTAQQAVKAKKTEVKE